MKEKLFSAHIEQLVIEENKSFKDITNGILANANYFNEGKYEDFTLYLKVLTDLYDKNSRIFYKNESPIFTSKIDLVVTILIWVLTEMIPKNLNHYKDFFHDVLYDLTTFGIQGIHLIEGCKEKGFLFDYLLYIPSKIDNNTLIVEGNNSVSNYTKGEMKNPLYISDTLSIAGSFQYFLELNAPIFIPLLPSNDTSVRSASPGYHESYARQLSRNTVNPNLSTNPLIKSVDDHLYCVHVQLQRAIEDAKKVCFHKTGVALTPKSLLYGFSTSGNLAVRQAFLFPNDFCGVIAGGINAAIPLPISTYRGKNLIYPVGTYDYKTVTGTAFDYELYRKLNQYYFMGDCEEQEKYNTVVMPMLHDQDVKETYEVISLDLYERVDQINAIYKSLGLAGDRIEIYSGFGHTPEPAVSKIKVLAFQWMQENQKSYCDLADPKEIHHK